MRLANLAWRSWQPGCTSPIRLYGLMLPTAMKARVYIGITLLGGLLSLSLGLFHGQWTEPSRYLCYLALALLLWDESESTGRAWNDVGHLSVHSHRRPRADSGTDVLMVVLGTRI